MGQPPKRNEPGPPLDEIELARVVGVFGVRGEVRVHLHNRESDALVAWRRAVLVGPGGARREARVRARSGAGNRVIAEIEGVVDRDAAAALAGWRIAVPREALPPLPADEAYVWQIVGLPVFLGSERVGEVAEVHTNCPTPILEVVRPGSAEPSFVPLVAEQAVVDVAAGRVDLAAGALDEP